MKQYYGYLFVAIGVIIIIATRLHHLMVNPHLTEAQALLFYWPLWGCAAAWGVVGYFIDKKLQK